MDGAAHVLGEAERRLLVGEGDEADRALGLERGEDARQLQQPRHPAGVVVGARAAAHGVVVGADRQDLVGQPPTRTARDQVAAAVAADGERLALGGVALRAPLPGDVIRRGGEGARSEDVPLADRPGERGDVRPQPRLAAAAEIHAARPLPRASTKGR
ncbi:MAG TPA: hypothetical protein VFY87_26030 [Geminicoccaceae bacterium]|nr:hypothetical protein [Geminicoccaceae bacterium]